MGKDKDSKKTKGITSTEGTGRIRKTTGVAGVKGVAKASAIKGVSSVSAAGKASITTPLDFAKRDKYFSMITEEAEKLVKEGVIPKSSQEVIQRAVQMAIDASLLDPDDEKSKKGSKTEK